MMTIVGGTYREICLHPHWISLFGSGLRAASACASLVAQNSDSIVLHTWVPSHLNDDLQAMADSFGFALALHGRRDDIEFQYDHGLSKPRLFPDPRDIARIPSEVLADENVLSFSLIEGETRIRAKNLVFDPQAGRSAILPSVSGHSAENLAIVANFSEASAMVGDRSAVAPDSHHAAVLGRRLLDLERAVVVVVKNGSAGATVVTRTHTETVASYITGRVFPIGSGDVFSAVFAFFWLLKRADPVDAARLASQATAYYCENSVLPIPVDFHEQCKDLEPLTPKPTRPKQIYLAGPLFTLPQLWLLNELKRALEEQGFVVFSPKDEVGLMTNSSDMRVVAQADLAGLIESDLVFAILDGFDPGTLFEIGYARSRNIPVIGFEENAQPSDLTMLIGTDCQVFNDLPTAVYNAAWTSHKLQDD